MKIVSFAGKKRSGKDTASDHLVKNHEAVKYALASPFKHALAYSYAYLNLKFESGVDLNFEDFDGTSGFDREQTILLSNKQVADLMRHTLIRLEHTHNLVNKSNDQISFLEKVERVVLNNTKPWSIRRFMQTIGTDIVCDHIDNQFWNRCMIQEYINNFGKYKYFIITDVRLKHEVDLIRSLGGKIIHIERDGINSNDDHISESGVDRLSNEFVVKNNGSIEDFKSKITTALHY